MQEILNFVIFFLWRTGQLCDHFFLSESEVGGVGEKDYNILFSGLFHIHAGLISTKKAQVLLSLWYG